MKEVTKGTLLNSADYVKSRGPVNMPRARAATQRDLDRLEGWVDRKLVQFIKDRLCTWAGILLE